jgi:hypothetical protein
VALSYAPTAVRVRAGRMAAISHSMGHGMHGVAAVAVASGPGTSYVHGIGGSPPDWTRPGVGSLLSRKRYTQYVEQNRKGHPWVL